MMRLRCTAQAMEIRMLRLLFLSAIATLGSGLAGAAEVSSNGFLVRLERNIAAPPAKVYDSLVGQVGSWWNSQHTYSGDSKNLSIDRVLSEQADRLAQFVETGTPNAK